MVNFIRHNLCISIHAPRTGSDLRIRFMRLEGGISIHAPRTGSDGIAARKYQRTTDFNPRSPHGERQIHPSAC